MEDDFKLIEIDRDSFIISTHVLRMEDDCGINPQQIALMIFQPTSSAWRTTWEESEISVIRNISTHVLRMEDDAIQDNKIIACDKIFQPTSSAWRTTRTASHRIDFTDDFNPRPPHGGRPFFSPLFCR